MALPPLEIPSITFTSSPTNPTPYFHVHELSRQSLPTQRNPELRTTRFVCISDTHNLSPFTGQFRVPEGDVLLVAGDLTNAGTVGELRKAVRWIEKMEFEVKVVIGGNHDLCLDPAHPDHPAAIALLTSASINGIHYLPPPFTTERITLLRGPQTTFTIFGCPLTPTTEPGRPLTYPLSSPPWSAIPPGTDIVLTHIPAKYHLDTNPTSLHTSFHGCESLRRALWRTRPLLHVCGHIHEARGAELVRWDLTPEFRMIWRELSTVPWVDPVGLRGEEKKVSKVDVTARGDLGPLDRHRETLFVNASIMKRSWSRAGGHGRERNNGIVVHVELGGVDEEVVGTLTADESERLEVVRRVRRRSTIKERIEGMRLTVAFAGLSGGLRRSKRRGRREESVD